MTTTQPRTPGDPFPEIRPTREGAAKRRVEMPMKTVSRILAFLLTMVVLSQGVSAQQPVQETRALQSDGRLEVHAVSHDIRVEVWDRSEMEVTGTVDPEYQELEVEGDGSSLTVRVRHVREGRPTGGQSLRLRVPRQVRLSASTVSGDLEVQGVAGTLQAHTVSGALEIDGSPASASVHTVSGNIQVRGRIVDLEAHTVSGTLRIREAGGRIEAHSVSGQLSIEAGPALERVGLNTVSGRVEISGRLASGADVSVQSHSGGVVLRVPANSPARYEVETHSGRIENRITGDEATSPRWGPGSSLRFTVGAGSATVRIDSFSGRVRLDPLG